MLICSTCRKVCHGAPSCPFSRRVLRLRDRGLTQAEIARRLGVSGDSVHQRLRNAGRTRPTPRSWTSPAESAQLNRLIRAMRAEDCSNPEIASETGLSITAVEQRIHRLGLSRWKVA